MQENNKEPENKIDSEQEDKPEKTVHKIPKMTVGDGDFDTQEQKVKFNKSIILGFLAKGVSKKAAASMAQVTEQTFYNYCREDADFKNRVDACLGGEDKIQAIVNISNAVKHGDIEASKYLLNKTRYYEKRYDPKWMDENLLETTKNPVTGIFEVVTDFDDITSSILGDGFEYDKDSGLDPMEQLLMAQKEKALEDIKELMDEDDEE